MAKKPHTAPARKSDVVKRATRKPSVKKKSATGASARKSAPKLLSGGNPQIPMGYGAAPVRSYIAATPGWKRAVVRRIDRIVTAARVVKAVKWNSPLYGAMEGEWFLSLHCYDRYVKIAFLNGADLMPTPPVASRHPRVRYWHIHEGESVDEAQLSDWVRQACALPGERM